MATKRTKLSVYLDPGVVAMLRVHARRRGGTSLASVVREACLRYVDEVPVPPPGAPPREAP